MKKLEGRTAIVTGASSGVGRGLAKVLAENGANVCVCARRMEKLEELKAELAAEGAAVLPVACDVMEPDQIKNVVTSCVNEFGGVDILINCAQGSMAYCEIEDIDIDYRVQERRARKPFVHEGMLPLPQGKRTRTHHQHRIRGWL